MAIIKCKMCGGDLILTEGQTVAECEYCGCRQTVPTADSEKKLVQFERAERLRKNCEFDKAAGIYESIISEFRTESEAYWGLFLCKYGIEYVDDPATGKKVPTCHRSSFDSVMEDSDLEQALENADAIARKVYREEAKQIEEIRKGIIEVSGKEEPYDIFICYKETDENGERTMDSVIAQDVYSALTDKGYRVFFSRITLEDKLGQEYEPYIFAALNSAKVMLTVGTDYEHFNAVWVKNEWSRFLKLMEKDKSKHLIPCYKGIDAYDMPKEFAKLQAQDMGKVGAMQDLLRGIDKLIAAKPAVSQTPGVQTDDVNRIYIYNSALEDMKSKKVKRAKDAVKKLESLGDWGDAPTQLEKAKQNLKKRKHRRAIRRIITWVLILSIIGGIVGLIAYQDYQDKKSRYERAVSFMEVEDYQNAYNYFLKAENYEDAPEQAEEAKRLMNDMGKKLIKQANELTDMGLYMTAGAYLEQSMSNNAITISSEDQDQIIEMINNNFMTGEERFVAWEESVDHEIDTAILEEYEMMAEALITAADFESLLTSMIDTGIADTAFAHEFVYEAVKSGMLEYLSLDQLKNIIPESLMPMVDMAVANSGMVVEIFENN